MRSNKETIKTIFDASSLKKYLERSASCHKNYYHYSDIEGISGILTSGVFWVSSVKYSNDMKEHNEFGEDTYQYFQLCFSTGTTENLPLWFLYSGQNGRGARICITKSQIIKMIDSNNLDLSLVCCNDPEKPKIKLSPEDYKAEFKDVVYFKKEGKKHRLKHNTDVNNYFPAKEFEKYKEENRGFFKDIVWFYEKETRLLIRVSEKLLQKDLFYHAEKAPYRLEWKIQPKIFKKIKITMSPYYEQNNHADFDKICKKDGINIKLSEYAGQVKIDLCKNCNFKKNDAEGTENKPCQK